MHWRRTVQLPVVVGVFVIDLKGYVFSKGDIGTFTAVKHHIDAGNSKPIKQRMRPTPLWYANEEQEHLEKSLKAGVIEPSCSQWASPSVLVRKRDGSVRRCIDLRTLNDVTVKDFYPLPLLQDWMDASISLPRIRHRFIIN